MRRSIFSICVILLIGVLTSCGKEPGRVEYRYLYANMGLTIPQGWSYEIEELGKVSDAAFGIHFWPDAHPDMLFKLYFRTEKFGLCGTGVTFDEVTFENGLSATICTEGGDDTIWMLMIYHSLPGEYTLETRASASRLSEYEDDLNTILNSATLGKGVLSEPDAIEAAKAVCTISYDFIRTSFDYMDGTWEIELCPPGKYDGGQIVRVDKDGVIQDI